MPLAWSASYTGAGRLGQGRFFRAEDRGISRRGGKQAHRFGRCASGDSLSRTYEPKCRSNVGRLGRNQCGAAAPGRNQRGIAANWLITGVGQGPMAPSSIFPSSRTKTGCSLCRAGVPARREKVRCMEVASRRFLRRRRARGCPRRGWRPGGRPRRPGRRAWVLWRVRAGREHSTRRPQTGHRAPD